MRKYDVFISYRRDGGDQAAKAIHDNLRERGYRVFLDVEALRSGAFNTKLYSVMDECSDVVVVLSPDALTRCANEGDWLRLEVAHALRTGKNVIPVMLRNFEFPASLPPDIDALRMQNGVAASVEFFDAFLDKLCSFLKSRGGLLQSGKRRPAARIAAVALGATLVLGGGGAAIAARSGAFDYPVTASQKGDVESLLSCVEANYTLVDGILTEMDGVLQACDDYMKDRTDATWQDLSGQIALSREAMASYGGKAVMLSDDQISALADKGLDKTELEALCTLPDVMLSLYADSLDTLEVVMDPESLFTVGYRNRNIELYEEDIALSAENLISSFCRLTLPIKEKSLERFKQGSLPTLHFASGRLSLWSRDVSELDMIDRGIATRTESLMDAPERLVNREEAKLQAQRKDFVEMLVSSGKTREEAETYVEGILADASTLADAMAQQQQLEADLAAAREEMRLKFAPQVDDDPYLVWGKALRYLTVRMHDEAKDAFQFYMQQMKDRDIYAATYVPAVIRFIDQMGQTGIDYGIVVSGYEPGKPQHAVYRPGDIIVAVNGVPCRRFDDFERLRKEAGTNHVVTLLRADASGTLRTEEVTIPENQPMIALMELTEAE